MLEYILKMAPVMEQPAEIFVSRRNVEKPQTPSLETRHSPAAFPETDRDNRL